MAGSDQYLNSQMALQGAFYNPQQQQPVYSYEEMQLIQQSLLYAQQQGQNLVATTREGVISPAALGCYSMTDATKYKNHSTLAQQQQIASSAAAAAAANGSYVTMAGAGGMVQYNPYTFGMAVPGTYPQYATPAFVQIPSSSHSLPALSQYAVQPKFYYGNTSVYNENITPAYQKPAYHSGTPPPAYRPELGPVATTLSPQNAYPQMLITPMSPTPRYPSPVVPPPHQDMETLGTRRGSAGVGGTSAKGGGTKGSFSRSNWGGNN